MATKIEWAEESWNPITGCTPISEGCQNCYAKKMAQRLKGRFGYPKNEPFKVTSHYERFELPLKWKKPKYIFVCSMSDFAHEKMPMHIYRYLFFTMYRAKRHTFLILTKRPNRMAEIIQRTALYYYPSEWPFKNVYLGVTAENQQRADERIPILLQIPAAKRFVSVEPMLGPVDLCQDLAYPPFLGAGLIDWVILGGESGSRARPMHPKWARFVRDQCQKAGVPFWFKQWGSHVYTGSALDGNEMKMAGYDYKGKKGGYLLDGKIWNERP